FSTTESNSTPREEQAGKATSSSHFFGHLTNAHFLRPTPTSPDQRPTNPRLHPTDADPARLYQHARTTLRQPSGPITAISKFVTDRRLDVKRFPISRSANLRCVYTVKLAVPSVTDNR
ncbi:hypothetical protein Bbelb_204160, partial [Branchiostoma belcheri]